MYPVQLRTLLGQQHSTVVFGDSQMAAAIGNKDRLTILQPFKSKELHTQFIQSTRHPGCTSLIRFLAVTDFLSTSSLNCLFLYSPCPLCSGRIADAVDDSLLEIVFPCILVRMSPHSSYTFSQSPSHLSNGLSWSSFQVPALCLSMQSSRCAVM